ncbi:MAG: energy transducer TonB [Proteobacteria bacterium]|nr:energy transducer TonB [Pseudomonadota bacterium]
MGIFFKTSASFAIAVVFSLFFAALWAGAASADDASYEPPKVDRSKLTPPPTYPPAAQWSGEQGTTTIKLRITSSGRAVRLGVERSSGFADLDNAAVAAVLEWHYLPAMRNGESVSDWMTIDINFRLPTVVEVPAPTQVENDPGKLICRKDFGITGTHIPSGPLVCLTQRQWDKNRQQEQQNKNEADLKALE